MSLLYASLCSCTPSSHAPDLFKTYLAFLSLLKFDFLTSVMLLLMLNTAEYGSSGPVVSGVILVAISVLW